MFKVLHKTPPIPDSLSSEGRDFLQKCFRRNPAERPTAAVLLEHPFIRNASYYNAHGAISPTISAMKISSVCVHVSYSIYFYQMLFLVIYNTLKKRHPSLLAKEVSFSSINMGISKVVVIDFNVLG